LRNLTLAAIILLFSVGIAQAQRVSTMVASPAQAIGPAGPDGNQIVVTATPYRSEWIQLSDPGGGDILFPKFTFLTYQKLFYMPRGPLDKPVPYLLIDPEPRNAQGAIGSFLMPVRYGVYAETGIPDVNGVSLGLNQRDWRPIPILDPYEDDYGISGARLSIGSVGTTIPRSLYQWCQIIQTTYAPKLTLKQYSIQYAQGEWMYFDKAREGEPWIGTDHHLREQPLFTTRQKWFWYANGSSMIDQPATFGSAKGPPFVLAPVGAKILNTFGGCWAELDPNPKLEIGTSFPKWSKYRPCDKDKAVAAWIFGNGERWGYTVNNLKNKKEKIRIPNPFPLGHLNFELELDISIPLEHGLPGALQKGLKLRLKAPPIIPKFRSIPVPVPTAYMYLKSDDDGDPVPQGKVDVIVNGKLYTTCNLNESAAASFSQDFDPGVYQIQLRYHSDNGFADAQSDVYELTVQEEVATEITLEPPDIYYADSGSTITAHVDAIDWSSPAGTVELVCTGDDGQSLSLYQDLDSNGDANFDLSSLGRQHWILMAYYDRQNGYSSRCTGWRDTEVIGKTVPTQTTLQLPSSFTAGPVVPVSAYVQTNANDGANLAGFKVNLSISVQDPKTGNFSPLTGSPFGLVLGTVEFTQNQAAFDLSGLAPGTYQLDANFPAQGDYQESDSGPQTLVVYPGVVSSVVPTHIKLTVPNPIYRDDTQRTGSVQVTADDGSTPPGTVTVTDVVLFGNVAALSVASFHYPDQSQFAFFPSQFGNAADNWLDTWGTGGVAVGFDANFSPDDDTKYAGSNDGPISSILVDSPPPPAPAVPSVSVSPIPATMIAGQDPTATVTVTDGRGNPLSGNVWLHIDGFPGSPFQHTLDGNGQTVYHFASLVMQPPGITYRVWAEYPAQNSIGEIDSTKQQIKVVTTGGGGGSPAATTMSISAPPITDGSIATVTVTVQSAGGTPIGTVQMSVSGGKPFPLTLGGSGTASINLLPTGGPGDYTLDATYVPTGNFQGCTAHADLTVNPFGNGGGGSGPIATTLSISAPSVTDGSNAIVNVSVTSNSGTPTGSVKLSVSGGIPIVASLDSRGIASYNLHPTGGPGDYTLDATFVPTGNFQTSKGRGDLIVEPSGGGGSQVTTITISAPLSPIYSGNQKDPTLNVSVSSSDGTIPRGTLTMSYSGFQNNQAFPHVLNSDGTTKFTLWSLPPGTYLCMAEFEAQGSWGRATATAMIKVQ